MLSNNSSLDFFRSFEIRNIPENVRFWMIRTKKGYFYDEFISQQFVALGWNIITSTTDTGKQSVEVLKQSIAKEYRDSRPMGAINKCKNFIYEIHEGDYLVIPNNGSTMIAFAKAGKYYEEPSYDVKNEIDVIGKIDNSEYEISQVKCPYRKRRHIEILNVVDINSLGYGLRRAISSYHGISNFDDYAIEILNGIYDCYAYLDDIHLSINITKKEEIKSREISRLMYALTEFFCEIIDEDSITTTINLNSPGSVRIKLIKGFEKIKKAKVPLVCLFLAITGGSGFGFELPGLAGAIKAYRTMDIEIEQEEIELENKQVELEANKEEVEAKKIENARAILQLLKEAKEQGIDVEKLMEQIGLLEELDVSLQFETKENNGEYTEEETNNAEK